MGLSLLVFNPYTSAGPWGLMGGLRYLHEFIYEYHSFTILMFAGIGIVRSLLALALLLSIGALYSDSRKTCTAGSQTAVIKVVKMLSLAREL